MFCLTWGLNEIGMESNVRYLMIDLLDADNLGGLSPLRHLVLRFIIYYFLVIALAVITFITPRGVIYYETVVLITLLVIGLAFFFYCWHVIKKILKYEVERQMDAINELCHAKGEELMEIISKGDREKEGQMKWLSEGIDTLYKERDRLLKSNTRIYDSSAILAFLGSFLIPLITYVDTVRKNEVIVWLINSIIRP